MRDVPPGEDFFDAKHSQMHGDFGFSGSIKQKESGGHPPFGGNKPTRMSGAAEEKGDYASGGKVRGGSPPFAGDKDTFGSKHVAEPMEENGGGADARGGSTHPHGEDIVREEMHASGGKICHMAHGGYTSHHPDGRTTHHNVFGDEMEGMSTGGEYAGSGHHLHPHGHSVVRVEQELSGAVIHHHAHGGKSVHHADGRITHHGMDGTPAHMMRGGIEHMHDESEYVHRARGGRAEEKSMIRSAFKQHDMHEHDGAKEHLELARGGRSQKLPRGMKEPGMRVHSPIGDEMPVNRPPRFGRNSTTPRNDMPGGQMAYGVEPGSEPDVAGSEQGIPQLRKGGIARR